MTNKDKALEIVNKLFEISEQDFDINISGHCGGMVVGYKGGDKKGFHILLSSVNFFFHCIS